MATDLKHSLTGDAEEMRSWCKFCGLDPREQAYKNPCHGKLKHYWDMALVEDALRQLSALPDGAAKTRLVKQQEIALNQLERDFNEDEFRR